MAVRERKYQSIQVVDLTKPAGFKTLRKYVERGESPTLATLAALDCALNEDCKCVLIEKEYIDRDHSASYSSFYVRAFQDVPRRTTRLHFFSRRLRRSDLDDLSSEKISESYIGQMVLRPLAKRICGRSVLQAPTEAAAHFHLAAWNFEASLAGSRLQVRGSPFMEQDARVAACATAALWMSAESLAPRLHLPRFTTNDIAEFATMYAVGQRALPSGGLTKEQMAEAFRRMGFDPVAVLVADKDEALSQIYPYVESGLAPVLLLSVPRGDHAVVAVGHTYNAKEAPPSRIGERWGSRLLEFWRSWQWVDGFLVNDDQRGPYRPLKFVDSSSLSQSFRDVCGMDAPPFTGRWTCPVLIDTRLRRISKHIPSPWPDAEPADLWGAIIPLPPGISLDPEEAHGKVGRIIGMWYASLELDFPDNLHLRTYLIRAAEFKERMSSVPRLHPFLRSLYRGKSLPRWLWVTEVAFRDDIAGKPANRHVTRGEVVLDANSSPETPDFVSLHMPLGGDRGHVATMLPKETTFDHVREALKSGWLLYDDYPYSPLLR